ncbi:MAG: class II aldolase/adducin family protein [Chloroflexi bacterium]|nr:class II aldolase/adducin family protein [Chloroflexota bacterium]
MIHEQVRHDVAGTARQMVLRGLAHGTSGNVSARIGPDLFAVTPTGTDHASLAPEDIVVLDATGRIVAGRLRPTSEVPMHLGVYLARPDVGAIVHTHSDYATAFSILREPIPAAHYLLAFAGPSVPCAEYATYGTPELAANAVAALAGSRATLLANHGVLAVGPDLRTALTVAESVEVVAGLYHRARTIGEPRLLDAAEMARVATLFTTYGQPQQVGDDPPE